MPKTSSAGARLEGANDLPPGSRVEVRWRRDEAGVYRPGVALAGGAVLLDDYIPGRGRSAGFVLEPGEIVGWRRLRAPSGLRLVTRLRSPSP